MNTGLKNILKIIILIGIIFISSQEIKAQNQEYILKAGFLEKFARFSEWPDDIEMDTFRITVIGKSDFTGILKNMYKNHTIKGKPVVINQVTSISKINNCHMLFIATDNNKILSAILGETKNKPVLTVSEHNGFGKKGVLINFIITREGTIHFEINYTSVKNSGISMDIFLLEYAKIIE